MTAKELLDLTAKEIIDKIQFNIGLNQFAIERSKFEAWFKVELIDTLVDNGFKARPEINRIDVTFENTAIELKTVNTSYNYDDVVPKTRPITKNVAGIVDDIAKLKEVKVTDKFVVFIVFPLNLKNNYWQNHIKKVERELSELVFKEFTFRNLIPATIYYGKV